MKKVEKKLLFIFIFGHIDAGLLLRFDASPAVRASNLTGGFYVWTPNYAYDVVLWDFSEKKEVPVSEFPISEGFMQLSNKRIFVYVPTQLNFFDILVTSKTRSGRHVQFSVPHSEFPPEEELKKLCGKTLENTMRDLTPSEAVKCTKSKRNF